MDVARIEIHECEFGFNSYCYLERSERFVSLQLAQISIRASVSKEIKGTDKCLRQRREIINVMCGRDAMLCVFVIISSTV